MPFYLLNFCTCIFYFAAPVLSCVAVICWHLYLYVSFIAVCLQKIKIVLYSVRLLVDACWLLATSTVAWMSSRHCWPKPL